MAIVEQRQCLQPIQLGEHEDTRTQEHTLIQAAAHRAKLLHQQRQAFSLQERQTIKRGEWALQQLLKAHQRLIQRLVTSYQTHRSEFADFEQEAIFAFCRAVATYETTKGSRLSTWAYVQIRNRLQELRGNQVNHARATINIRQSKQDLSECEPFQDQGFIRASIQSLTRKQQEVVRLHLDGFVWDEIAKVLKTTADAVRMLWTRAIQRVRRLLLREEQETQEQSPKDVPSPHETKNPGEPLLRRLFRRLPQNWIWIHPLMGESLESKQIFTNPRLPHGHSSDFYQLLAIARQRHWLLPLCHLNDFVCRYFELNPSCANGVRGSPS